nr:DMT family transporter [Ottowia sp.]
AVAAVLAGITLLLWDELAQLAGQPAGIVWMQGAAFAWSLGTTWMQRARLTLPPEALVVWMMAWSAAVIAVLAALLEPPQAWHFSPGVWVSLVWAVLINYGAAQVIWFGLARALPPATSAMSVMAVPLIGTLSAPLIVGEWPRWQDLAAMACVVVAIGAVLLRRD